jgi:hypothetical protein
VNSPHSFCPGCGSEAAAGASFCGECGHTLSKAPAGLSPEHTEIHSAAAAPPVSDRTNRDNLLGLRRWILVAIIVVLVLGGAITAVALSRSNHTGPASNSDNAPVPRIHADPSSPSYRDGYGEGQALSSSGVHMSWSGGDITTAPLYVCVQHDPAMPSGDNLTQWGLGCVAAVKAFGGANGTPPSAVNSSPPTGSTGSTGNATTRSVGILGRS